MKAPVYVRKLDAAKCLTNLGASPPNGLMTILSSNKGFTLVELIVVCALIVLLSALSMNGFAAFKQNARKSRCMSEIRGMEKDISAFAVEKGGYPASLAEIGRGDLLDPWGNLYVYRPYTDGAMRMIVGENNSDFDLYSLGGDGATGVSSLVPPGDDDIIRFSDGGFVGLAKDF